MKTLIISLTVWGLLLMVGIPSTSVSAQTVKKIQVGSHVPDFKLPDQNGKVFDVRSVLGKKNLVIYFYPKDGTSGCTKEACDFRDNLDFFKKSNATVVGISGDNIKSHQKFANNNHLNFTILSDQGNRVRKLFGVPASMMGVVLGRVTYIVDRKGIVIHIYNSLTKPENHILEALSALKYEKK
jgi:thioredoxin-dependent peroxiredoxin